MRKIDPVLHDKLAKLISSMGYELLGCELNSHGGYAVFRIYIDKTSDQRGVTVDDCSRVSHQVSALLDVEEPIQGRYSLEISSPGIDRPLFELKHYTQYIGSKVKIRLSTPFNGRKQYKGTLVRVEAEEVFILTDDSPHVIALPFSSIEKANLIGDIR